MWKWDICHLLSISQLKFRGEKKKTFSVFTWWRFVCRHCRSSEKVQGGTAPAGNRTSEGNNAWWAHVWCMMVPRLGWQHMVQFAWFLYLLFDSLVLRLETMFSHPDHTCCRLVFISDFSFLYTAHTLACLNLWKTPFGGSEDVRWGEKSWRIWGFYWLKRWCPAVSQTGPLWQVCLLSCRRWFPECLLVISAAQTVGTRVTRGPEAHR